jgi:hypothetical protein
MNEVWIFYNYDDRWAISYERIDQNRSRDRREEKRINHPDIAATHHIVNKQKERGASHRDPISLYSSNHKSCRLPYQDSSFRHHRNHSPYMFGLSARIYASNVLFNTVLQLRSASSSPTSSIPSRSSTLIRTSTSRGVSSSPMTLAARAACRRVFSPLRKRLPRSGQFRDGSKGSHLIDERRSASFVSTRTDFPAVETLWTPRLTKSCESDTKTNP